MAAATPGRRLVELLARPQVLAAPGVADALAARLVAEAGFSAVYMSGDATTAARLGQPDVGLLTMSEMVDNAGRIADAVGLPVIADADTGYGGPVNVRRTVREYERAGVAAIQMEDQVWPKRCGHLAGKRVIPAAEMAAKVKAAVDSRRDQDFLIIARTDVLAIEGFQAALDRVGLYREAGADILFVEAPTSLEQLQTIGRLPAPTMYNASASGRTPILDQAELTRLGFALAIYPGQVMFAAIAAMRAALGHIQATGDPRGMPVPLATFTDYVTLLGLDEVRDFETAHGTPEDQRVGI